MKSPLRAALLGLCLIACGSDDSSSPPGNTPKDGSGGHSNGSGGTGGATGPGAGGDAPSGGDAGHATGGGTATGGVDNNGGTAGNVGAGGHTSGGHGGAAGDSACPPECFVANQCAPACGLSPTYVGCCACPSGTVSLSTCSGKDSGAP